MEVRLFARQRVSKVLVLGMIYGFLPTRSGGLTCFSPASSRRLFQKLFYRERKYDFLPTSSGILDRKQVRPRKENSLQLFAYKEWRSDLFFTRQQPQAVSKVVVSGTEVRLFAYKQRDFGQKTGQTSQPKSGSTAFA
jgi:hypothetical protein